MPALRRDDLRRESRYFQSLAPSAARSRRAAYLSTSRSLPPRPPRSPHHPAGFGARGLAILEHLDAVDEDVLHARGVLVRLVVGGVVLDVGGIEEDGVGEVAGLEEAAVADLEFAGGQGG